MSVQVSKHITDIDESAMLPSQLIDSVSGIPEHSDFINDRPENTFQTTAGSMSISVDEREVRIDRWISTTHRTDVHERRKCIFGYEGSHSLT